MLETTGAFSATNMSVVCTLVLQVWGVARTIRHLDDRMLLVLFMATVALAARSGALLGGLLEADLMSEIPVLAVSAAVLAASYLYRPEQADLDLVGRTLLDKSPNPIMLKKASGEYEYINPAFMETFGVTDKDVIGLKAEDIWEENLSQAAIASDKRVLETGQPSTHRVTFKIAGKPESAWVISKFAMPMPHGPLCIATVYTDLSEQVWLEKRLAESEARIQTLLDNSPSPIYFKDRELRFILVNRRYCEVYGVSNDQIRGRTSIEVYGEELGGTFSAHDHEVLENRSMITHEENLNDTTFMTMKFPIINNTGELIGVGGIETDITDRVAVEKAYRKARDEAEMANRSKSTFLANMSHELRTPLNSIIGFSDSLLAGTLGRVEDPKHREYLQIIRTGGEHLLHLINDILDLSRIEAGKMTLEETEVDLKGVFTDSIRLTAERAGKEGIYIDNRIPTGLPKIIADERQLRQVLINLLSNAIKFTDPGGKISASAGRTDDGGIEIHIEDNGVGIGPEDLKRVLQPFVQVSDALTRKHQGSGLGLAIVNSIISQHGGTFTLESTPGEGTTAIIILPPARVLPDDA